VGEIRKLFLRKKSTLPRCAKEEGRNLLVAGSRDEKNISPKKKKENGEGRTVTKGP